MPMPPLLSIDEEAAACRAAFAAIPDAKCAVHLHHEEPVEALNEPAENRIHYILAEKPVAERALRLRLFRPVTAPALAEYQRVSDPAWAEYERVNAAALAEYERVRDTALAECQRVSAPAHAAFCVPGCPFDGKSIFGRKE